MSFFSRFLKSVGRPKRNFCSAFDFAIGLMVAPTNPMVAESVLRNRKEREIPKEASKPSVAAANATGTSRVRTTLTLAMVTIAVLVLTSFLTTRTLTFGFRTPNPRKFLPREEKTFTLAELAQYDGSDPDKPILLADQALARP